MPRGANQRLVERESAPSISMPRLVLSNWNGDVNGVISRFRVKFPSKNNRDPAGLGRRAAARKE
jgi:hypothetical protein